MKSNPVNLPSESEELKLSYQLQKKLAQEHREMEERDERRIGLKHLTGIHDDALLDELITLEFTGKDVDALYLMPLVEVAWVDGTVTERERADVLSEAESLRLDSQSPGYQLLESWLKVQPKSFDEFRKVWQNYVRSLPVRPILKQALRADILRRALHVAEVDGRLFRKVSPAQRKVLEVLEAIADAFDDA